MAFTKRFVGCNFMWPFSFLQTMGTAKGIARSFQLSYQQPASEYVADPSGRDV
jgi:hypothetical protein